MPCSLAIWPTRRRSPNRSRRRRRRCKSETDKPAEKNDPQRDETEGSAEESNRRRPLLPRSVLEREDLAPLAETRSARTAERNCSSSRPRPSWNGWKKRHRRRDQKATSQHAVKNDPPDAGGAQSKPVDPKEMKAGYQKAIELAPKAVEQMERAVKSLKQKDPPAAYPPAEEARKILEEIQKAQPKQDQQDRRQQGPETRRKTTSRSRTREGPAEERRAERRSRKKKDEQKKDQEKRSRKRPEEAGRAEAGSETAAAAVLARSDRGGAAQGA